MFTAYIPSYHQRWFSDISCISHQEISYFPSHLFVLAVLSEPKEIKVLPMVERKILAAIAKDARLQVTAIAKAVNEPQEVVKYHLKALEKQKIILKYRPSIWKGIKDLGYQWYFMTLQTEMLPQEIKRELYQYFLLHPYFTYVYKTTGNSDIQIEIKIKTTDDLDQILGGIRGILKERLKRYELLLILHEYKYTYFPDCLMQKSVKKQTFK